MAVISFQSDLIDNQYASIPIRFGIVKPELFSWTPSPFKSPECCTQNTWALGTGEFNKNAARTAKPAQPYYRGYYAVGVGNALRRTAQRIH